MRKNFGLVNKIKGLTYQTFLVTGLNREFLLNRLKKQGVNVYNVKRKTAKQTLVTVPYNHIEKFFAISKELCYNVKKVKSGGRYYPVLKFFSRAGVVLGIGFFIFCATFSSNFVFKITYHGSGAKYSAEVSRYLNQSGVKKFSNYKKIKLKELSSAIVSNFSTISFAECVRRGGELKIYLVENKKEVGINTLKENLVADVSGEIVEIKVYRGVALKKVGDRVDQGDIIVSGETIVLDKVIKTGVLAYVKIVTEKSFTFTSLKDNEQEIFLTLAKNLLSENEVVDSSVKVENNGQEFIYTVLVKYCRGLYSGL